MGPGSCLITLLKFDFALIVAEIKNVFHVTKVPTGE